MHMRWRLLALMFFALVALVAQAPAWLFDQALDMASAGAIRLQGTNGTVWNGRGTLLWLDRNRRQIDYRAELAWQFAAAGLLSGRIGWQLSLDKQPLATIAASMPAWQVDGLQLRLPARLLLEQVPHPVAKLGWQGDIRLDSPHWQCTWANRCEGALDLAWSNAAADLLRGHSLGDYQARVQSTAGRYDFSWATLRGETRIDAKGNWAQDGSWQLHGSILGDPVFLQRLPAVAGQFVRPGAQPGEYRFDIEGSVAARQ